METDMKNYWVSWYDTRYGKWELHSPWWVSGERMSDGAKTICAAIRVPDEDTAKQLIILVHDEPRPDELEWRFISEKDDNWTPFCDRFQRADWMEWPPHDAVFIHETVTCEHDFQGWRDHADGRGGEQVCTKCGIGAMAWSLRTGL